MALHIQSVKNKVSIQITDAPSDFELEILEVLLKVIFPSQQLIGVMYQTAHPEHASFDFNDLTIVLPKNGIITVDPESQEINIKHTPIDTREVIQDTDGGFIRVPRCISTKGDLDQMDRAIRRIHPEAVWIPHWNPTSTESAYDGFSICWRNSQGEEMTTHVPFDGILHFLENGDLSTTPPSSVSNEFQLPNPLSDLDEVSFSNWLKRCEVDVHYEILEDRIKCRYNDPIRSNHWFFLFQGTTIVNVPGSGYLAEKREMKES